MELEIEKTEVVSSSSTQVEIPSSVEVSEGKKDYKVSVAKKEYIIVGDSIYITSRYEDAPPWLKEFIDTTIDIAVTNRDQSLIDRLQSILSALDYVPKNQYTEQINQIVSEDGIINSRIATLNSNFTDAINTTNATIAEINLTYASKDEAAAIAINALTASLSADGEIGSALIQLQEAYADLESTTAQSINMLESVMEGEINGNATAMETIRTYVGISESGGSTGTGLLADVSILQKQNDGVIETVTGTYDVMINPQDPNLAELVLTAEPYASWKAQDVSGIDTRLAHIGDVYIKYGITSNGAREYVASFKFIRTIVDASDAHKSTDADGFTWALIVDQASQDAYTQALNAYDLADNKRRVFVSTPHVPYDIGDLWLVQAGAGIIGTTQGGRVIQVGDVLRCSEAKTATGLYENNDWIPADNYRESMDAIQTDLNNWRTGTYAPFVTSIQTQVDGKAETFYQNSVPTGRIKALNVPNNVVLNKYVGDLWKNTYVGTVSGYLGNNTEYVYTKKANGANWDYNWTKMEVPDIVFDTIDTKKSIYSGDSVPAAVAPDVIEVNDMWITGSNVVGYDKESIYVWNGSAWVKPLKYTDDSAAVALQTGLANGTVTVKLTNAYVGTTPFLTYLTNEIDNKVGVYSGETAPVAGQPIGVATNDIYLWFTTTSKVLANGTTQVYDITRTYKYSGSAWNEITTDSNITALADLADGKRTVFSGNTLPIGAVARDIWIPSATNGTYLQGEIYQYNGTSWVVATKYSADLEAVRNNLQSQVDGKVDTYYQGTVPTGMTVLNNGDYWYCTADVGTYKKGKVYKYVYATTSWVETADVSRYAFDTADGKAAIFTSTNTPKTGYKVNDMLIVIGSFNNGTTTFSDGVVLSSNANRVSGFTASDWVKKINDTEDLDAFVSTTYTPTVTSLQNQVDGKVESWYTVSTSDPKSVWTDASTRAKHDGDMWYQTDTKRSYWYSSSTNSWNLIDDAKAIQALANAATAQATADGVVVSFYAIKQDTAPATTSLWLNKTGTKVLKRYTTSWVNVAVKVGDTLTAYDPITKDTSVYVYAGTGWITNTENGIVAGSEAITTLTANLATTDTKVGGHTTQLNTVDTRIANGVASVESKWAYNSIVNINNVYKKSGFGLSTNYTSGSGTQADPYVSEFWIDASRLKFTNSNQTGQVAPFTIDATGTTPKITFNGIVNFANTNIANGYPGTTKINGGLLETNTVTANKINTIGLIAENISATEINGITINGGVINGARINGAVIKASYLDLDGELELLTNYRITTAMYNSNPALYRDAVYISADNQYRIPTMSVVNGVHKNVNFGTSTGVGNDIGSYLNANAGHNRKAVKLDPTVIIGATTEILSIQYAYPVSDSFNRAYGPYIADSDQINITIIVGGKPCYIYFKPGGASGTGALGVGTSISTNNTTGGNISGSSGGNHFTFDNNITINGIIFNVKVNRGYSVHRVYQGNEAGGYDYYHFISPEIKISVLNGVSTVSAFNTGHSLIEVHVSGAIDRKFGGSYSSSSAFVRRTVVMPNGVSINNML